MTPAEVILRARQAVEALQPKPAVFLERERVPVQAPAEYVLIDYITGTPDRVTFDARPKTRLLQVTCYSRDSRAAAFALQGRVTGALTAAGLREGQDRDAPPEAGYWGAQTDWRS